MLSYNVASAVQQALRARADWMEQGQTLALAQRITPTTVDPVTGQAAVRCPDCWDPDLRQSTVPNDATCLGVGWIITASGSTPQQGGYLTVVPLPDAFINDQEQVTQWTSQGIAQYNADRLYWSPGPLAPKKLDVIIRTGSTLAHDRRYVVGDQLEPKTLGSAVLFETAALELRHEDNIIYQIPAPADTAGLEPGTWT